VSQVSDTQITELYLNACAVHIQWLIDRVQIKDGELLIEGWAIAPGNNRDGARFLINGKEFSKVQYPIPSPDLHEVFWNIPAARNARFICRTQVDHGEAFADGFARLEFFTHESGHQAARQRAWYLADPGREPPIPDEVRIRRVIGVENRGSYLLGGATMFKRFEEYLTKKFCRGYADFANILDWGCGCGRLSRYFAYARDCELCGVDVDHDNVAWCRKNLLHGRFARVPLLPPTLLPEKEFDLIVGISVLTHLSEENQFAWLTELRRVAKPGAIVMLSVHGLSQSGLYRPHPSLLRQVEEEGFVVGGRNDQLDGVIRDSDYYLNVYQSRDYIRSEWGRYFTILDIVDAIAANQDLVVMRNDPDPRARRNP